MGKETVSQRTEPKAADAGKKRAQALPGRLRGNDCGYGGGGLTEEEAVSRLGSPEKIGETLLENTEPESRRRIDVPGTLLAALSLVLTAVSVWRYLTIRSIFGTFAGLSEQSVSVIGGADGPTSIFVAGKVSQPLGLYAVTACLILVTVFYFVKKYRK